MFTSFIQYLLMTPTYINILNVYAFCNTHDITWGTKGDTKPEKLGAVNVTSDGKIKVDLPTEEADLNTQYEKELFEFSRAYKPPKKVPDAEDKKEDYYKGFRSVIVLGWMFSNLALCAVVLQIGGIKVYVNPADEEVSRNNRAKIYLAVVLWSVAGLSFFRFVGAIWFLIVRMVSATCRFAMAEPMTVLLILHSSAAFDSQGTYLCAVHFFFDFGLLHCPAMLFMFIFQDCTFAGPFTWHVGFRCPFSARF
jgi:chitin synthase